MYPEFPDTKQGRAEQQSFDRYAVAMVKSINQPDYRSRADIINREEQGEPYAYTEREDFGISPSFA